MTTRPTRRLLAGFAIATTMAFIATGCGSSDSSSAPKEPAATKLGKGEGRLDIIAWAGYAEDGSNDPKTDWVTPFETDTGCKVNVKTAATSDEPRQTPQMSRP